MKSTLISTLFICFAVSLAGCDGAERKYDPVDPPDKFGDFAVGYTHFTALDSARANRELPLEVWFPVDPQDAKGLEKVTYPLAPLIGLESEVAVNGAPVSSRPNQTLLVFSHGYGGISNQSIELMEALASHGFVVVAPEHTGNAQGSLTDDFESAALKRVPDVSFVIDTMLQRNQERDDLFYQRLDTDRVGVLGHSFGGMTAIGMASGWAGAEADERVVAIVPISAVIDAKLQSTNRESPYASFSAEQLARVTVPVLLLGGTADQDVAIENNDIAFEQLINAPIVYQVNVIGANHTHFTNVCVIGELLIELGIVVESWPDIGAADLVEPYEATCTPDAFPIDRALRLQKLYVISFFKKTLHQEIDYDQYLNTNAAKKEPDIQFRMRD